MANEVSESVESLYMHRLCSGILSLSLAFLAICFSKTYFLVKRTRTSILKCVLIKGIRYCSLVTKGLASKRNDFLLKKFILPNLEIILQRNSETYSIRKLLSPNLLVFAASHFVKHERTLTSNE